MNRGTGRRQIFVTDDDRSTFLSLVGECATRWGVRCHALVLMTNHFHLLVEDLVGQLSRAMRHLCGVYTQRFNRAHNRDGPLFRGRFRARVVQTDAHLAEVVRYIHLNPVQSNLAGRAGDFPWSSHRQYLDPNTRSAWLEVQTVLARFGGDTPQGRAALDRFVHQRVPKDVAARLDMTRWQPVLGSPDFERAWRSKLRGEPGPSTVTEPSERRRFIRYRGEEVLAAVAEHFGVDLDSLERGRRRTGNLPRAVALYLLAEATDLTQRQVAELIVMSPTSVGALVSRFRERIRREPDVAEHLARIREALKRNSFEVR